MHNANKNLLFGNNISERDSASTRILFINPNRLDLFTDAHRLNELLENNTLNKTNILLLAETNTHWKEKRATELFRSTIAKHWKGVAVSPSKIRLNWDLTYKPGDTTIITDKPYTLRN